MKTNKNSGFSLIELIVVVALIGILTTAAVISFSSISTKKEKQATETICEMMSQCKMNTLSGMSCSMLITEQDGELVAQLKKTVNNKSVIYESKKLGKGVKMYVDNTQISSSKKITFSYGASRGNVSIKVGGSTLAANPKLLVSKNKTYTIQVYTYSGTYEIINT